MWRSWLPVNQVPSDDEEAYASVDEEEPVEEPGQLVSPRRPPQSPSASPRALLIPDPPSVEQVLGDARARLRDLPDRDRHHRQREAVIAAAAAAAANPAMPDPVVDFEDENGEDVAGALKEALQSAVKLEWDDKDIPFFFQRLEIILEASGAKKQYTKFQVLSNILPKKVQDEVKSLLIKKATEFPHNNAYKLLKTEVLRVFGPKTGSSMDRALGRVLAGKPSQLARALVRDVCKNELNCQCCPDNVLALWRRQLPSHVRAGIASMPFNKDNFNNVVNHADDIFDSQPAATVAAVKVDSLNETLPGLQYPVPEVAAINRGGGGRGGGRGYRGGRGNRGNRGSRGGGNGQTSADTQSAPTGSARFRGPKHPDLPPGDWKGCGLHYRWGRSAHFCAEPATCPWKNIFTPKPPKNN